MGEDKSDSRETIAATSYNNTQDSSSDSVSESGISKKNIKNEILTNDNDCNAKSPIKSDAGNERHKENRSTNGIITTTPTIKEEPTFNIRIVPLENLLADPQKNQKKSVADVSPQSNRNKNTSIIELSDSDDDVSSQDQQSKSNSHKGKKILEVSSSASSSSSSSSSSTSTSAAASASTNSKQKRKSARQSLAAKESLEKQNTRSLRNKNNPKIYREEESSSQEDSSDTESSLAIRKEEEPASSRANNPTYPKLKRCAVRVQRVKLPQSDPPPAPITKNNKRQKMSSDVEEEAASTSAAKRQRRPKSQDDESEYDTPQEEEEHLVETDDDDNEKDKNGEDQDEDEDEEQKNDSSDSEVMPQRKRRSFNSKRKTNGDNDSNAGSSDFEPDAEKKQKSSNNSSKKKRRRIKRNSSGDSADDGDDDKNKNKRKHIRKIIKTKDLDVSTKEAAKEEDDRRKRIEERQKLYNRIFEKSENVEITELILDFDEDSKRALLQVDKGLLKKLKPHQVAGVKFMWDACFETLKDTEEKPGSGCILAHCMGLGKTLQVVTLTHTLLINTRRTGIERVLVITPLSTVNNWAREFVHWMNFANRKDIEVYDISRYKDKPTRIFKLNEWYEEGGVCILGYDMYRILANEKAKGVRKKQREQLQQALVEPGPDLVVCDEGHLLKNEKTSISKAVTRMRTKRRIVLTGTPLQNNLKEYYCMIQFVKPNLLGTYKEYMNRFVNPISNGQYTDSTERDLRLMKHRSHILHTLLEGCIQRRDYSVLAPYLPPKHEYVIYTTLSELQQQLYGYYMTTHRDQSSSDICGKGARLFQDFQDLRRIWTHPMNLRVNSDNVIAKRLLSNDDSDLEGFICDESEEEAVASNSSDSDESFKSDASMPGGMPGVSGGGKVKKRKTRNGVRSGLVDSDSDVEYTGIGSTPVQKDDPSEWWKPFVEERELNNVNHSPKLLILLRLLQQCEAIGDKLLVFSQSLQSLDVIEHFLSLVDSNTKGYDFEGDVGNFKGCWTPGEDYFRLDGSCSVEQREAMCKKFNNATNLKARLFLISTRAGGLGINLVAANRVVIFDVSWNPSHDTQSIFRVYRFGQVKPCYIYRLIAMGTMEQKVYERQVAKLATAKRVIDEQQISRHYNQTDLMELYTYELKPSAEREMPILPKDRLFAEILTEHESLIFKYHEHDSLLEQEEHENLTEEERKSAWAEYEAEKTRTVQASQYMSYDRNAFGNQVVGQFGNASGSVTSNKIFGFRSDILLQLLNMKISKDHPELTQNQVIQLVPSYLQQLYNEMNNGDPTMYKDLLNLHSNIVHPSGMYMNPLLYANQNPSAAGYNQGSGSGLQPGAVGGGAVIQPNANVAGAVATAPGFEADKVYEID
ncbi:transcriptional regulator ATRX homolog [Drosophila tropicalis]|uniref:transcriptional regulator ATRX homolog n=1 Tax=Drosophila tropicalis TaxID=46794 RepID=UPI0035AB7AC1